MCWTNQICSRRRGASLLHWMSKNPLWRMASQVWVQCEEDQATKVYKEWVHTSHTPVSVPTGPSSCTLLQICQGSHWTQTTLAQHCKVVKLANLGVILRITQTKKVLILVRFTSMYIIADLCRPTWRRPTHEQTHGMSPPLKHRFLSRYQMHDSPAFPAPWDYLCSFEYLIHWSQYL